MKKKYLSRVLPLLLALVMVSGNTVTAFASEADTQSADSMEETQTEEAEASENTITKLPESEASDMKLTEVSVIPDGVVIGDIEVGGMTGEEAYKLVEDYLNERAQETVDLSIDEEITTVSLEELGLYWANEGEVSELLDTVSKGNLLAQYKTVKDIENKEADTSIQYALDESAAVAVLDEILIPLNVEPQNATCSRNADGTWNIVEEVDGIVADSEETAALINTALSDWDEKSFEIEVPAEVTKADISSEIYEGMSTQPIASFSTVYYTVNPSRNRNVEVAAQRMNGRMVMPDEVMSVLDLIGPVTAANGYGLAGSYIGGKTVDTIGGGICQVATTFYNTALLLELEIENRRNHSMSVDYVDPGMDATVFPNSTDLTVRNSTSHALYIESYVSGRNLVISFYGVDDRPANREIRYRSVILEQGGDPGTDDKEDTSMKVGTVTYLQSVHRRTVSQTYKDIYIDGALSESVPLTRDTYQECQAVRRYGPAIDDAGTHYYIDDQGYAVGADGTRYRLNPDGTFLDLPPANQTTEESTEEETPASTAEPTTTAAPEATTPAATTPAETEPSTEG